MIETTGSARQPHEMWWSHHIQARGITGSTFAGWLSQSDPHSRRAVFQQVETLGARSVLEFGPGTFLDYQTYWRAHPWIGYRAVELTPELVAYGQGLGAQVVQGSIGNSFKDYGQADVAYCRHVLEHLPGYHNALETLLAHARKAAIVVFFQLGEGDQDSIVVDQTLAHGTYCNVYSRARLEAWLAARGLRWSWARPATDHILTIYMDDQPAG
jgi:hypothetical protein